VECVERLKTTEVKAEIEQVQKDRGCDRRANPITHKRVSQFGAPLDRAARRRSGSQLGDFPLEHGPHASSGRAAGPG
jgi:hypothetical protein